MTRSATNGNSALRAKAVLAVGFLYGLGLATFAIRWGIRFPTLTMPFAAAPLNLPIVLMIARPLPTWVAVATAGTIAIAPFCWAAVAFWAVYAKSLRSRLLLMFVLVLHYLGIGIWFYVAGRGQFSWPLYVLRAEMPLLILFYVAGQDLLWWTLATRTPETTQRRRPVQISH